VLVAVLFLGLNASRVGMGRMSADAILVGAVAGYVATSQLIISRLPGKAVGWLLGLIAPSAGSIAGSTGPGMTRTRP
jgi:hypothetical protein